MFSLSSSILFCSSHFYFYYAEWAMRSFITQSVLFVLFMCVFFRHITFTKSFCHRCGVASKHFESAQIQRQMNNGNQTDGLINVLTPPKVWYANGYSELLITGARDWHLFVRFIFKITQLASFYFNQIIAVIAIIFNIIGHFLLTSLNFTT